MNMNRNTRVPRLYYLAKETRALFDIPYGDGNIDITFLIFGYGPLVFSAHFPHRTGYDYTGQERWKREGFSFSACTNNTSRLQCI